jgi:benzoyl-CoA reductase/2-hydroxyglutaryl-CoA dehydratase subunit BcrC/BadD/HgdB
MELFFLVFHHGIMPFGGHQQMCRSKIMQLPYIHLITKKIVSLVIKKNNEAVDDLLEIRDTKITIERFEKICKQENYHILHKRHYLLNPIYKWKFKCKAQKTICINSSNSIYTKFFYNMCVLYNNTKIIFFIN